MALNRGTTIGPFQVVSAIGAGGMGEVYRALDTRLQREVALKVLPEAFAADAERLARFEREARLLAILNHPNIAQVYGIEESGDVRAIVMELVPGIELAERIAGGAISSDEALAIALEIATGLEAAHEQGIVHRDLKPANIKLRPDGGVKILDFGLGKAFDPGAAHALAPDSTTVTSALRLSGTDVILGTAPYMAPEQARGRPVDRRADVWAFGCVLFEMLTGKRAFPGSDATEILAAVMRTDPDWSLLPPDTPANVRTLLRRALAKNPRERLPDIGAARLELQEAGLPPPAGPPPPPRRSWAAWTIAAASVLAAALATLYLAERSRVPQTRVFRTVVIPPAPLPGAPALRLALSPDGRRLAFMAPDATGSIVLWVRRLDETTAQALPGTNGARAPFWSPDSESIAFIAEGKLRRVAATGGTVLTVCDSIEGPPGAWNRDDVILFMGPHGTLHKVSAKGGASTEAMAPEPSGSPGPGQQFSPFFLPDQRRFLFSANSKGPRVTAVYVGSLDSPDRRLLLEASTNAMYADGYLLFLRDTMLMAQRFDPGTLALSGSPVPLVPDVQINPQTGTGAFSVSQNGVLVYQSGASSGTQLEWLDRNGKALGRLASETNTRDVQLSPDGALVSATFPEGVAQISAVWVFDIARGRRRRVTFEHDSSSAVWSPDGTRLVYASVRDGVVGLYQKPAGVGAEELLLADDDQKYPIGFTRDGAGLLYARRIRALLGKLVLLPLAGERKPRPLFPSSFTQVPAEISPDGRWLAYVSDETGRREVYVTSFPDAAGRWLVSTGLGDSPRWRPDGKELFYTSGDRFMAVDVDPNKPTFDSGAPHYLFDVRLPATAIGTGTTYAVARDGQRFLFNRWAPGELTPISVFVNWPSTLTP
jgi:Tol biopolymer transport system component